MEVALFLIMADSEAANVFHSFQISQAEEAGYETVLQKSEGYCVPSEKCMNT